MQVETILTIAGGAAGAAVIGLLGAWIHSLREHARWVREQRLDAYRSFLQATELTFRSQSKDQSVWRTHMDEMAVALGVVAIVGPDSVATAASAHLDAQLDAASVQRRVNGVDDGKPQPDLKSEFVQCAARAGATRAALVNSARKVLKIKP